MADNAFNALFDGVQVPSTKKRTSKTDVWMVAIKNRDYGLGLCDVCGLEYQKTSSRSKFCALCRSTYKKMWAQKNSDKLREDRKRKYEENKEESSKKSREYYLENKEKALVSAAKSRAKKMADDPDAMRAYNRDRMRLRRENDPSGDKKYRREYVARRIAEDPIFALNQVVSRAVRRGLASGKEGRTWTSLVGYSLDDLREHLEKLFLPGMTWKNRGRGRECWHIDHVIPLSVFNFRSVDDIDFKRAWALSNLQPLWEPDNLAKQAKLTAPFQPSLAF